MSMMKRFAHIEMEVEAVQKYPLNPALRCGVKDLQPSLQLFGAKQVYCAQLLALVNVWSLPTFRLSCPLHCL